MSTRKLTLDEIKIIKDIFSKDASKFHRVVAGYISDLMELSNAIGEGINYSVIQNNLNQLIK